MECTHLHTLGHKTPVYCTPRSPQKCTYTRASTPVRRCSTPFAMQNIAAHPATWALHKRPPESTTAYGVVAVCCHTGIIWSSAIVRAPSNLFMVRIRPLPPKRAYCTKILCSTFLRVWGRVHADLDLQKNANMIHCGVTCSFTRHRAEESNDFNKAHCSVPSRKRQHEIVVDMFVCCWFMIFWEYVYPSTCYKKCCIQRDPYLAQRKYIFRIFSLDYS